MQHRERSSALGVQSRGVVNRIGMVRRVSTFQTLALWTTVTTYLLIFVGGLVRASGAGLGCPDWPRCFGSWIPPASAAELPPGFVASQFNPTLMWTEYLNRLLGVLVGLLILATLISAWRHHRQTPNIFWPTLLAFLLVVFQGWLGGVVVQHELAAWIVTIHMIVALVIVSLLLYATVYARLRIDAGQSSNHKVHSRLAWSAAMLIAVTLLQIVLGTQVRERVDEGLADGLARMNVLDLVGAFDRWHRAWSVVVVMLTMMTGWLVWAQHRTDARLIRAMAGIVMLVALQVLFGVTMTYLALTPAAQVGHLTGSSLLVGAQTVLLLLVRWEVGSEPRPPADGGAGAIECREL